MKITILGGGNFGTAIAAHMLRIGHEVIIDDVAHADIVFIAVPSYAVEETIQKAEAILSKNEKLIICSKGFASPDKLLSDIIPENIKQNVFFLYGPTLADEIKNGELSGMVLAGGEGKEELKKQIEGKTLRIETTDDIIGVQIGAALKNVVTIFVGIAEGAKFGDNTQALIFTRGVNEIHKLGLALGARTETFLGLTCIGDLTLHSRNRHLGVELGKGRNMEEIIKEMNYTPEGIQALKNAHTMARILKVDTPLIDFLYGILFEGKNIKESIESIA